MALCAKFDISSEHQNSQYIISPVRADMHALQSDIRLVPTTELKLERIKTICRPIFEETRTRHSALSWAGLFGSVSRGTQRPDSDIDIMVGYSDNANYLHHVCYDMAEFNESLPKAFGREVDIVPFIHGEHMGYVYMEGLLTAQTIWGEKSWPEIDRVNAERLLRQGHVRMIKASEMMSRLRETTISYRVELASPEHHVLRLSVLRQALAIIDLIKIRGDPFFAELQRMIWIFAREEAIRSYVEGHMAEPDQQQRMLEVIWTTLSDSVNVFALKEMVKLAKQTFQFAGLSP